MKFIKTTIVGGIVFMVPTIIIIVILGKAFELMLKVARPIDKLIPIDSINNVRRLGRGSQDFQKQMRTKS
jgi:hypothetical protein